MVIVVVVVVVVVVTTRQGVVRYENRRAAIINDNLILCILYPLHIITEFCLDCLHRDTQTGIKHTRQRNE